MNILTKVALYAAFAASSSLANAALIEISQTSPSWSNAVGGSNISYNGTSGNYTDVRWGISQGFGKSGLGFDPLNPPIGTYETNTIFQLGNLRHYNNPIQAGSDSSSVDLSLKTTITGATPTQQTFAFRFHIDETPNTTPCAYPSTQDNPCADRITFQNLDLTSSFILNSIAYTIELLGFSSNGGATMSSQFISQEGTNNTMGLYARVTEVRAVPEPAAWALFGIAFMAFGLSRRRPKMFGLPG